MRTDIWSLDGVSLHYRPKSCDMNIIREVIEKRSYRKSSIGFDVEPGEHWLDLGANIGAFAAYCKLRGATASCYEPDHHNFLLLTANVVWVGFSVHRFAVTSSLEKVVTLWRNKSMADHARPTVVSMRSKSRGQTVSNLRLVAGQFDGVKMDIEGAEMGLIDEELIPQCKKLVLEYHTSRDRSSDRLGARLEALKSRFKVVSYPAELDRLVTAGGDAKTFFDRLVFCIGNKKPPDG